MAAVTLAACGDPETKCQFTKKATTTYNFNQGLPVVASSETVEGCYSITKTDTEAELNDTANKFSIKITTAPPAFFITDGDATRDWKEVNGFKVSNTMSGDTLILRYMPTEATPESVLKFGAEYKFYN